MFTQYLYCLLVTAALLHLASSQNAVVHSRHKRHIREVNFIQQQIINARHPRPILDTARPEELCCNTKQHNIGIAFVNGYDAATGALTNLIQIPQRGKQQFGKGITQFLDMIGGRLVGLQR